MSELYLVKVAYFAFFHSHLSFGLRLWGHASGTHKVLLLQKKAIRVISKAGFIDHCKPLFVECGVMTVVNEYIYQCVKEVKERLDILPRNSSVHDYSTRHCSNIFVPRCRLHKSKSCFPVTGYKFFNSLPTHLRDLPKSKFLKTIRDWLISNPFYSITEFIENIPLATILP